MHMKHCFPLLTALVVGTATFAENAPDSIADCLEAAKLLMVELDKIDPTHGFTQQSLTQQLFQETGESAGGPYICQAYLLLGADGSDSLESIALEYYVEQPEL